MAQPAEIVVPVKLALDTRDARRQVRRLRKGIREADVALAKLEAGLETHLDDLSRTLRSLGIRLEVEES